jgi:hypothetical protein
VTPLAQWAPASPTRAAKAALSALALVVEMRERPGPGGNLRIDRSEHVEDGRRRPGGTRMETGLASSAASAVSAVRRASFKRCGPLWRAVPRRDATCRHSTRACAMRVPMAPRPRTEMSQPCKVAALILRAPAPMVGIRRIARIDHLLV